MGVSVNETQQIVIIGGGAGGSTAAQFARKTNRSATIILFEKGPYPQYSKCGLPYAIAGVVPQFQDLIEFSEEWFKKEHIDLHLNTTVEHINLDQRTIAARKGKELIEQQFDTLILATGAHPWIPPLQHIENNTHLLNGVFSLRTIHDGQQIQSHIQKGKKATVIGAGLIGLEMADCLSRKGMKVTVVEALPTILANTLDDDLSKQVQQQLEEKITILTNHRALRAEEQNGTISSLLIRNPETGEDTTIPTDLLVIATGTKPETTLAQSIGCTIGKTKAIQINEKAATSIPGVYAVGDCTEYKDFITNEPLCIGLGSIVVRQAIAAGTNAAGGTYTLPPGVLLTRTSEFFDIEIAAVGPIEHQLTNMPVIAARYTGSSLPEYFPGKETITMKVCIHEDTGVLLSAQAVGANAAQRINTLACAILRHTPVDDFKKLETAYAPPIAPTLDPVTLVCDVASLKRVRKRRGQ